MEYDCGFSRENNRFRYRAAAIIVEEGYEDYLQVKHRGIEHIVTDERA
jgi:hypothetical protein